MTKTITEKYVDGQLVERVTVEDTPEDTLTVPQETYPWFYPWWGVIPPQRIWRGATTGETITTDHIVINC